MADDKVSYWSKEIDQCLQWHKGWRARAEAVEERYKNEKNSMRFNILWSNTETIEGVLLGNTPKPAVQRRHKTQDPITRAGAEVMEKALSYEQDSYDFMGHLSSAVKDNILPGFGQVRVRYVPIFESQTQSTYIQPDEQGLYIVNGEEVEPEFDELGAYIEQENDVLVSASTQCEHVRWTRFFWQPADRWAKVDYCLVQHFYTRDELTDEFGAKANDVALTHTRTGSTNSHEPDAAEVFEIWDRRERKILFMARGQSSKMLDERDDELELEGFYPWPEPLLATTVGDKLIPYADFFFYQQQAAELDELSTRIYFITRAIKVRSIYDASFPELADLLSRADNAAVPIQDFLDRFQGRGDLRSVYMTMPLDELIRTLQVLLETREAVKQTIYEITGIADIVRGSSDPNETLGAQRIKGQFASLRINRRKAAVERFVGDLYKIKAEIIATQYEAKQLSMMTGEDVTPEVLAWLKSDVLRNYRIRVDTDSLLIVDQQEEQESKIEFTRTFMELYRQLSQAVMAGAMSPEQARAILLFTLKGWRGSRQIEEVLENAFMPQQQPMIPQAGMGGPMQGVMPGTPPQQPNVLPFPGVMQ